MYSKKGKTETTAWRVQLAQPSPTDTAKYLDHVAASQKFVEELSSLSLLVIVPFPFSTFYKNSLNEKEPFNPESELCLISKNFDEVPFGCLAILFHTVQ